MGSGEMSHNEFMPQRGVESFTKKELNSHYIEWLDKKGSPKVYCTLYPDFIAQCFPQGVRIDE